MLRKCLLAAAVLVATGAAAFAGDAKGDTAPAFVNAFAGNWVTFEASLAAKGGQCEIELQKTADGKNYVARQSSCAGDLADVAAWGIIDQQLALLGPGGTVDVRLGGNQNMISGTLKNGAEVIFERKQMAERIHGQWSSLKCLYLGYTSKCASAAQLALPGAKSAGNDANVSVLVQLNARSEPRPDAKVVSVLAPKTCLPVKSCTTAANGAWCAISENGRKAWIAQRTIRLGKYPIATFVTGCSTPSN
jgi:hypothetical protein